MILFDVSKPTNKVALYQLNFVNWLATTTKENYYIQTPEKNSYTAMQVTLNSSIRLNVLNFGLYETFCIKFEKSCNTVRPTQHCANSKAKPTHAEVSQHVSPVNAVPTISFDFDIEKNFN